MCVVRRALEPDSRSVTPGSLTSTSATTGASPSVAVTRRWLASAAYVTATLRPVTRPSRYVVGASSRTAAVSSRSPETTSRSSSCCAVGAVRGERQRAAAERLPDRQVRGPRAGLAEQHRHLGQAEPLAAVLGGNGEPEQPGLGELGPAAVAVEHVREHRADRLERLGTIGVDPRESVSRHVENCNVF